MSDATTITRAEELANEYAGKMRAAGWKCEVHVTRHEAERYEHSGEVMLSGHTSAWVAADREWFEEHYHFGWLSWHGEEGARRRTTRYLGGTVKPLSSRERKLGTLRKLDASVSVATTDFSQHRKA